MAQLYAFPTNRIVRRALVPATPVLALPGYGDPLHFDNDGRGGSLSDCWRDLCSRHGVDVGIRLLSHIPILVRSELLEGREDGESLIYVRDFGEHRAVAVVLPRITVLETRHRRLQFFAKGRIDQVRTIAQLGKQLGEALRN